MASQVLPKWYFSSPTFATPENRYMGDVNEQLATTAQTLDTKYWNNLQGYNDLQQTINNLASQVREQNSPYIKSALEKAQSQLKDYESGAAKGQWEMASPIVESAYNTYANDMNVKGALSDYEQQQAYLTKLQEKRASGDLNEEDYQNALAHSEKLNTAQVVWNPKTYSWENIWSGYDPVKSVDIAANALDFVKDWKANQTAFSLADGREVQYSNGDGTPGSVPGYYTTMTHEYVNEDEVFNAAKQYAMQDPNTQQYVQQKLMFEKLNDAQVNPETGGYVYDENGNIVFNQVDYDARLKDLGYTDEDIAKYKEGYPGITSEDLYNYARQENIYNEAIQPAATKASYDKYTADYQKDWLTEQAIDNANALELQKRDHEFELYKKKLEEKTLNPQFEGSINSMLVADDTYDVTKEAEVLKAYDDRLAQIEEEMSANNGLLANDPTLLAEKDQLLAEKTLATAIQKERVKGYITTDEGKKVFDPLYEKYVESFADGKESATTFGNNTTGSVLTKEEFALKYMETLDENKSNRTSDVIDTVFDVLGGIGTLGLTELLNPDATSTSFDEALIRSSREIKEGVNNWAKENAVSTVYDLTPADAAEGAEIESQLKQGSAVTIGNGNLTYADLETKFTPDKYKKTYKIADNYNGGDLYGVSYERVLGEGEYYDGNDIYKQVDGEPVLVEKDVTKYTEALITPVGNDVVTTLGFRNYEAKTALHDAGFSETVPLYTNIGEFGSLWNEDEADAKSQYTQSLKRLGNSMINYQLPEQWISAAKTGDLKNYEGESATVELALPDMDGSKKYTYTIVNDYVTTEDGSKAKTKTPGIQLSYVDANTQQVVVYDKVYSSIADANWDITQNLNPADESTLQQYKSLLPIETTEIKSKTNYTEE